MGKGRFYIGNLTGPILEMSEKAYFNPFLSAHYRGAWGKYGVAV
jgi:hypothetical protein